MILTVRNLGNHRERYTVHVWPFNPRFVVGRLMRGPGGAWFRIVGVA